MLAPMGSGALWARRELLEAMPPFLAGGEMIREVHLRRSEFNEIPWKFEAGTPAVGDAIGLGVAAEYLMDIGMDAVREHERELVDLRPRTLPREVPGIELYGPMDPDIRGGVIPFNLPGIHPHDVAQVLDRFGIAVRAGHHCTMPLHERLDLAATARASFNVYSTRDDIDALAAGLQRGPARLQRLALGDAASARSSCGSTTCGARQSLDGGPRTARGTLTGDPSQDFMLPRATGIGRLSLDRVRRSSSNAGPSSTIDAEDQAAEVARRRPGRHRSRDKKPSDADYIILADPDGQPLLPGRRSRDRAGPGPARHPARCRASWHTIGTGTGHRDAVDHRRDVAVRGLQALPRTPTRAAHRRLRRRCFAPGSHRIRSGRHSRPRGAR